MSYMFPGVRLVKERAATPNDDGGYAIQLDGLADNGRRSGEIVKPVRIVEHGDGRRRGIVIARLQRPPKRGRHAQRRKIVARDKDAPGDAGLAVAAYI